MNSKTRIAIALLLALAAILGSAWYIQQLADLVRVQREQLFVLSLDLVTAQGEIDGLKRDVRRIKGGY